MLTRTLLAAIALLAAPEWYRVGENSTMHSYVDRASIQPNGQWTRAEEWAEYRVTSTATGVKRVRAIHEVDCAARQLRIVHFTSIRADGSVSLDKDWPDDGKLHGADAGTLWGNFADFVCGTDRSKAVRVADPMTGD